MARSKTIRQQGADRLREMFARGKGTQKHIDKQQNGGKPAIDKVYVDSTLNTYLQGWHRFCDYIKSNGESTRKLDAVVPFVQPFIDNLVAEGYSAYTIHTWVSGVAKVLGLPIAELDLPKRRRVDITRSRLPVRSDAHFSPANHQDLVDFCRSVGPRNHKELAYIRGSDLATLEDGSFAVDIHKGKGGKQRLAPIYGPPERIEQVVEMMRAAGDELLFPEIPYAADIHSYRAEYACTIYRTHARPLDQIPREEQYICRKDLSGTIYDKRAMKIASEALGHSRLDVIAQSYLWALNQFD